MKRLAVLIIMAVFGSLFTAAPAQAVGGGVISVKCKFSHTNFDDPIVFPGVVGAAHHHGFVGAKTTNANSTYDSMIASGTSCPVDVDTAGYWFPLIVNPNGSVVKPVQVNIYYRSPSGASVSAFPADLRIIAGGDTKNPPQPSLVQRSLSYSCKDSGPFFDHPINCGTRATIAHVHFPNCLANGAIDSPDHRSHMKYGGKNCGTGYTAVPKVSFHIRYKGVVDGAGLTSDVGGSAPGQTLHADFWNTWDQDALEFLVDTCLNGGKDCKGMTNAKLANLGFVAGTTTGTGGASEPTEPTPEPCGV